MRSGWLRLVAALFLVPMVFGGSAAAQGLFGTNLLVNADAEAGAGSPGGMEVVTIPGWTVSGSMTVFVYASGGTDLQSTDPGPVNRGTNYFAGGPDNGASSMSQVIDLTAAASQIDAGGVSFILSGFLGGWSSQGDNAVLSVDFKNAAGSVIGAASVGPVTNTERNSVTSLLFREAMGGIPPGTRSAAVTLAAARTEGAYNDGYADNLALVLMDSGGGSTTSSSSTTTSTSSSTSTTTSAASTTTTTGSVTTTTLAGYYGTVNLAKDKTVTALTNTVLGTPQNAVDGDINTPWYSSQGSPSSNAFTLDLGASYSIGRMVVYPSQVHSFTLSTSEDGSTWTERYRSPWTEASVVAPIGILANGAYSARYVKFEGSADWNQYVGMIELAVFEWLTSPPAEPVGSYGTANLALNKTATDVAPLTSASGSPPGNALDGNISTSWVGNSVWVDDMFHKPSGTGLIKIDLGAEYAIGKIMVRPERVHSYTLVLSTTDATTNNNTYPSGARWLFRSYPEMFGTANTSSEPHTFDVKGNITARYIWVEAHTWETPTEILPAIAEIVVLEWMPAAAGAYGTVNLAKNKTVTALTDTVQGTPQDAVDGDLTTVWYSYQGSPTTNAFTVDLGASYNIGRIVVYPSQAHAFTLSTSDDGSTWTERYRSPWTEAGPVAPVGVAANGAYAARYVKFEGSANWNQYVGIFELAVFEWLTTAPAAPPGSYGTTNLALNKTATDVSPLTSAPGHPPGAALDGDASTSWTGSYTGVDDYFHKPSSTGVIKIDLGAEYPIGKITVRPERVHSYMLVLSPTEPTTSSAYPSGARWLFRSYPEMFGTANTSNEPHTFDVQGAITARYIWVETHTWHTPTEIQPSISEVEVLEWIPAAAGAYGTVNLAKDKTVTPITNTVLGTPQAAVDGDINTVWYSYQGSPTSNAFTLDLGASYSIGRMVAYPAQVHTFTLSTSEDGSTWTERYRNPWTEAGVSAPMAVLANGAYSARYVKFEGSANWNQYVGMVDIAVFEWLTTAPAAPAGSYGTANLALNKPAIDVSPITSDSRYPPGAALDGDLSTSWAGSYSGADDYWHRVNTTGLIKIDLGAEYPIGSITVRPERVHNYLVVLSSTDTIPQNATYPSGARWLFRSYPEMFGTDTTSSEPHTFDVKGAISARYIWVEAHTWEIPTAIPPSIAEIEVLEWTSSSTTSTTTTGAGTTTTTTTGSSTTTTLAAGGTFDFGGGWNLVGNSASEPIDVATAFGDTSKVTTVWKWVAETARWAFYAPSLSAEQLSAYAASKGYDVLSSIAGGEGFWVNAKGAFSVPGASGAPIASTVFQTDAISGQSKLVKGWNLIAIGDNKTPSQFNSAIGATPPEAGQIPSNVTTLWAWDAIHSNWYFYAPSLEGKGGTVLADYITSKGYLSFGSNALTPTTGFWVNKP